MLNVAGLELFPPLAVFLAFAASGLMLNLIPGADMVLVATTATRHGAKAGVRAALGIGAGTLVHILASVAGLAALLASDPMLYRALRIVGRFILSGWPSRSSARRGARRRAPRRRPGAPSLRACWSMSPILKSLCSSSPFFRNSPHPASHTRRPKCCAWDCGSIWSEPA